MISGCLVAKAVLGVGVGLLWRLHAAFGLPSLETWQAVAAAAAERYPFNGGTGFFVNEAGDFVSAAHVMGRCRMPAVQTPDGFFIGKHIATSLDDDVTVIRTAYRPRSHAAFPGYGTDAGWRQAAIARFEGCGGANSYSIAEATAMDGFQRLPGLLALVTDRAIIGGNSGSPVFDAQGAIIGMLVARGTDFTHYGIAVDALILKDFLRHADVEFATMGRNAPWEFVAPTITAADFTYPVFCLY